VAFDAAAKYAVKLICEIDLLIGCPFHI